MLFSEQLDEMAARGCQMPGCDHKNHDPVIFLHAKCHLNESCDCAYVGPKEVKIVCFKCGNMVCTVAVKAKPIKRCHVAAALDFSYAQGSRILSVSCKECRKVLANLEVK